MVKHVAPFRRWRCRIDFSECAEVLESSLQPGSGTVSQPKDMLTSVLINRSSLDSMPRYGDAESMVAGHRSGGRVNENLLLQLELKQLMKHTRVLCKQVFSGVCGLRLRCIVFQV